MGPNQFERNRQPVVAEEIVCKGTSLKRYTLEGDNSDINPDTTIYLSEHCPDEVGQLLETYATDLAAWLCVRDSHYNGTFLTPYMPLWLSTLDDGRFSIRCDFSHSNNDLIPFAILFHIFSSQEECMQFVARLPGIHDSLTRAYLLSMDAK